jgi:hypothetical protein
MEIVSFRFWRRTSNLLLQARRLRVTPKHMEYVMRKFFGLGRPVQSNMNTEFARARFARSMPGETAAMASVRFGGMSL